jgi:hypothetical protein
MSTPYPQPAGRVGWDHLELRRTRTRERLLAGMTMLIPLALALAISVDMPKPTVASLVLVVGLTLGVAAVIALVVSTRYTVTLTLLALYLGLLDGPVKLESASRLASGARDVLIGAIVIGMLMRLGLKRQRVTLPPLSGWVLGFVVIVLIEALNPHTGSVLKVIGGYRQQLEWVPFFFFGYLIVRSKQRFRQLFLLLGVIALANGVVGAYQYRIGPGQLASWGPGYSELVKGGEEGVSNKITGRTYKAEGTAQVRPPALGSDAGFGGGVGVIALPGLLALLAVGRLRRRWPVLLCCMGALLGIATSASRTSAVIGALVLVGFALLSLFAGLRVSRPLVGLVVIAVITFAVGSVLVATEGKGVFARQETLTNLQNTEEKGGGLKERNLSQIPSDLAGAPFGLGLGTVGSASGFGGRQRVELEGQKVAKGLAYNLLADELGAPGLLLWIGFSLSVIVLALRRLRRVADVELRTYLVAILTAFIALTLEGFSGPTLAVTVGAFLWFAPGVIAYWMAGAGWAAVGSDPLHRFPVRRLASAGRAGQVGMSPNPAGAQ